MNTESLSNRASSGYKDQNKVPVSFCMVNVVTTAQSPGNSPTEPFEANYHIASTERAREGTRVTHLFL